MCLALPGTARTGEATTLAVMPITMGAGSERYDGLGKALAGMLVSDLAGVEALQLVERERLDELMHELALSLLAALLIAPLAARAGDTPVVLTTVRGDVTLASGDALPEPPCVVQPGQVMTVGDGGWCGSRPGRSCTPLA